MLHYSFEILMKSRRILPPAHVSNQYIRQNRAGQHPIGKSRSGSRCFFRPRLILSRHDELFTSYGLDKPAGLIKIRLRRLAESASTREAFYGYNIALRTVVVVAGTRRAAHSSISSSMALPRSWSFHS
jgi:hypothetical protein